MATITKRGDAQWQVKVRLRGHPPVSKTFETKAEAERWAKRTETELADGEFIDLSEARRTTLGQLVSRYRDEVAAKMRGAAKTDGHFPAMLEDLKGDSEPDPDTPVFGLAENAFKMRFRRVCAAAKIEDFRFHDLRHEATSRLFEGTDLRDMEISAITGHKTMAMLKRYAHLRTHLLADRLDQKKKKPDVHRAALRGRPRRRGNPG